MPEDETTRFTLATLNLRFGLADDGENRWSRRKAVFPDLLRDLDPDFLCVQEANDFQVKDLAAMLPGHRHIGRRRPAPKFWQNNVIFHRKTWACTKRDHFFLSPTPDVPSRFRDSRWPRQCTLGLFRKGACCLALANTHFDFDETIQRQSADIILRRLSGQAPSLPAVVAGDLNAKPGTAALGAFADAGFQSAVCEPHPATVHGFTGRLDGDPIDWILHRGQIGLSSAAVVTRSVQGRYPSDHFPVRADFRLPCVP